MANLAACAAEAHATRLAALDGLRGIAVLVVGARTWITQKSAQNMAWLGAIPFPLYAVPFPDPGMNRHDRPRRASTAGARLVRTGQTHSLAAVEARRERL